ncbi:MAG: phage regulatory protein/antirepressor Ant [Pseudomonadota bacterium]
MNEMPEQHPQPTDCQPGNSLAQVLAPDQPLTMSSREIAELCEKEHRNVRRDIRKMLEELGEDVLRFEHTYTDASSREQEEYLLPKDLTITLIAGYKVVLRKRIIDRWMELERQAAAPPNLDDPLVLQQLLVTHTTKRIEAEKRASAAEARAESMAEDVAAHEILVKADGSITITEAAKNLGMRPGDLFKWLDGNGWTYKRPGAAARLGYQDKCNRGLLEHKATTVTRADGSEKITEQVRVTAKGMSRLAKLLQPTVRLVE